MLLSDTLLVQFNNTLLCTIEHEPFKYRNYYDSYWTQSLEPLNIHRKPHDTRHTCVSLMMEKEIPPTTIKEIINSFLIVNYEYRVQKDDGTVAVLDKKINNASLRTEIK